MGTKIRLSTHSQGSGRPSVAVLGVGCFAHGVASILRQDGADVAVGLTRDYGHWAPAQVASVTPVQNGTGLIEWLERCKPEVIVPQSIEWAQWPVADELIKRRAPILCPTGDALLLERDRDFARQLCRRFRIPFPQSFRAANRADAQQWLDRHRRPYVIKNPLCGPHSPVHTIVCESVAETRSWLDRIDDSEGVFLQEYLGRAEIGHIALVSGGEVYSLVTNQEYKRAFDGNLGIVAGAPLGGLIERDPDDRYRLAHELIRPLLPWFRAVGFHGPVQVTAMRHRNRWYVLEYNVRLGVTSGTMILRSLKTPLDVLRRVVRNEPLQIGWIPRRNFGCSVTLAGYGYPYTQLEGPRVPVECRGRPTCDIWWNEVEGDGRGVLWATGHRLADINALAPTAAAATRLAYENIRRLRSLGGYFRQDVGQSLWPPGNS